MTYTLEVTFVSGIQTTYRVGGFDLNNNHIELYDDKSRLQFLIPLHNVAGVEFKYDAE